MVTILLSLYRYHKRPRMKAQKMENLSIAFSFMLDVEHIPLVNIGRCIKLCWVVTMTTIYFTIHMHCGIYYFIYNTLMSFIIYVMSLSLYCCNHNSIATQDDMLCPHIVGIPLFPVYIHHRNWANLKQAVP